jgi:hypothetical protein
MAYIMHVLRWVSFFKNKKLNFFFGDDWKFCIPK